MDKELDVYTLQRVNVNPAVRAARERWRATRDLWAEEADYRQLLTIWRKYVQTEPTEADLEGLREKARRLVDSWREASEPYAKMGFDQWYSVARKDIDLWSFADSLRSARPWLGSVQLPEERIELRLRAWHVLGGLVPGHARFVVYVVRTAVELYRAGKWVLTARDIQPSTWGPTITGVGAWRALMGLVEQESSYFLQPGPRMTGYKWERPIDIRIIGRFLKVETVEDYLLATAQLHVDAQPWLWRQQPASASESLETAVLLTHRKEVPSVTNIYNTTINSAAMVTVGAETVNVI